MAIYTYDEEADALYVLLVPEQEAAIHHTVEVSDRLHVDIDEEGKLIGVEILYPRSGGVDLAEVRSQFGLDVRVPFTFAA